MLAANPVLDVVVEPVTDHKYVKSSFSPVTFIVIEPSESPLHEVQTIVSAPN